MSLLKLLNSTLCGQLGTHSDCMFCFLGSRKCCWRQQLRAKAASEDPQLSSF